MEDPMAVPLAASFAQQQSTQQEISQDTHCEMPSSVNKFDNIKRRKPWEVFKKQTNPEEQVEQVVQYDSFRDKCSQTQQSGSGFTAMINSKKGFNLNGQQNQQEPNTGKTVTLTQQHKKNFKGANQQGILKQNPKTWKQLPLLDKEFNGRSSGNSNNSNNANNFGQKNGMKSQKGQNQRSAQKHQFGNEEPNENANNANFRHDHHGKEQFGNNKFRNNQQQQQQQQQQTKAQNQFFKTTTHELLVEKQDSLSRSDSPDSAQGGSDSFSSGMPTNGRRQKISGSWVRVADKQRLDKPPSYKDYLGALTSQAGKNSDTIEHFTIGDLEDGEIKSLLEDEQSLQKKIQNNAQQNHPATTTTTQHAKNFMPQGGGVGGVGGGGNGTISRKQAKLAAQLRKGELEEEGMVTQKKRVKPNDSSDNLFPALPNILADLDEPFHMLKRMDSLGNEVFKNKTGNNFQMQQTLAAQQDAFLHQYFNKQRQPHSKLLEASGIHHQHSNSQNNRKERKFDIKNYQVDLQKNMIEKKVTITEGLLNLAKIQNEMYSAANQKKRSLELQQSGSGGKYKSGHQNSSEKEYPDSMKDLHASAISLTFEHSSTRRQEKYLQALNQFEEKHMQQHQSRKQPKKENNDRMDDEEDEFERFNEMYLKQHEKMLEDIAMRNKENLKKTISNVPMPLEVETPVKVQPIEDNPLNILIKEELERNRQDKQAHSHRLIELAKLQESQHVKHLEMIQKKPKSEATQKQPHVNRFSAVPTQQAEATSSSSNRSEAVSSMANTTSSQSLKRQSKFSDKLTNQPSDPSERRLRDYQPPTSSSSSSSYNQSSSGYSRPYGFQIHPTISNSSSTPQITSLAQLQQQLFSNNSKNLQHHQHQQHQSSQLTQVKSTASTTTGEPISETQATQSSQQTLLSQLESFEQSILQDNRTKTSPPSDLIKNSLPLPESSSTTAGQDRQKDDNDVGAILSIESDNFLIEIPDAIKNKQRHMRPVMYDKMVNDYIRLQKEQQQQKEESLAAQQQERIQDPRKRQRVVNQPSADNQSQDFELGVPNKTIKQEDMEIEQEDLVTQRILNFSIESSSQEDENGNKIQQPSIQNNTVYNYKLLKSEKTMITQEKNLMEKNQSHEQSLANPQSTLTAIDQEDDNFGDLFKNEKDNRYFKDNLAMHCFKCGQNGHYAKWCTNGAAGEKQKCVFCLGDHTKDTCTSYVCFKCYSIGHRIKDCGFEQPPEAIRCRLCRQKGHYFKTCGVLILEAPKKQKDYESLQNTICLSCKDFGHTNCFDSSSYAFSDGLYQLR